MWSFCSPLSSQELQQFETAFSFTIKAPLRDFLLSHNAGKTRHCTLTTNVKERRMAALLDFSRGGNAWETNRRLRRKLGDKIIVIGVDRSDNFLCVRRNLRKQEFVIWNHITDTLEECTTEIPVVLLLWRQERSPNGPF